ncbi:dihydroxyacetone kinase subunit DhaL [Anoxybacterium hadale]|uniref:dihydroxyacetone kinase subunit DhaL n=1 Tax=Anoxybacterium hadale TaxID=3408580 RepID=UPI003B005F80
MTTTTTFTTAATTPAASTATTATATETTAKTATTALTSLTIDQTTDMILSACDAITASKDYLTEVDSRIGDGDHGIGMSGGMEKAKAALEAGRPFEDINTIFKTTGMTMLNSMGGASGVIFGSMFLSGVKGLPPIIELNGYALTVIFRNALDAIKARGGAQVGDKTMVDALEPAVVAMEAIVAMGETDFSNLILLLSSAEKAAIEGMENTKNYTAKFGRAKSLMERAIGYQDAGATSVAIIFSAMQRYVSELFFSLSPQETV